MSIILWWSCLGCLRYNCSRVYLEECNPRDDPSASSREELPTKSNTLSSHGFANTLCYWAWFAHPIPGSPPLGLLVLASHCLFSEDSELWSHIVVHWDFLSPANLNSLQHVRDASAAPDVTSCCDSCTIDLLDVHVRVGCRLLWPLVRSWLSELLPRYHLETLWDHFFANPAKPFLVVAAAVAALKYVRHAGYLVCDGIAGYHVDVVKRF